MSDDIEPSGFLIKPQPGRGWEWTVFWPDSSREYRGGIARSEAAAARAVEKAINDLNEKSRGIER